MELKAAGGSSVDRPVGPAASDRPDWEHVLVGHSPAIRQVVHIIGMVGCRRATVLITGETGTGKELAATAVHLAGPRRHAPIVALNCSALPDHLLESELFGHVRGAFTGAIQNRVGRFEQAHRGTLFLDEIGDLPLDLQAKLLRVLQEREFQRLGSSETVRVDVRVIAATNCDLVRRVEQGRFREDLFYRLNVVPIQMPALRERPEDIPLLAEHFVEKICRLEGVPLKCLTPDALSRLCRHGWPGNVRELENAVEMAVVLSGDQASLTAGDFPDPANVPSRSLPSAITGRLISVPDCGLDYQQTVASIERSILQQALEKTGGNKKAAARMLRLKRTTLSAKIRTLESSSAHAV
jgi:transcriptional regulator with GAF, ATPase, and Fis domain